MKSEYNTPVKTFKPYLNKVQSANPPIKSIQSKSVVKLNLSRKNKNLSSPNTISTNDTSPYEDFFGKKIEEISDFEMKPLDLMT